jgi:hypothetical protein
MFGTLLATVDAEPVEVSITNPDFSGPVGEDGVPEGWRPYKLAANTSVAVVDGAGGGKLLLIDDSNPYDEVGVQQDFPLEGGQNVLVSVSIRRATEAPTAGTHLQLRFFPGNTFEQKSLEARSQDEFNTVQLYAEVPEGTRTARIYIYAHAGPTPKVMVDSVTVQTGAEPPTAPAGSVAVPDATPPQYDTLKELHLTTPIVAGGAPQITIVAPDRYAEQARAVQSAISAITGVQVPVVADDAPEAAVPLAGHIIALGNRSTNAAILGLYERFYTLLDLKYPGPGGHVVRTLHNPFGDGRNAILAGGSDDAGVTAAAQALVALLQGAGGRQGDLSVGWLREIRLADGYSVPRAPEEMNVWEESRYYGSSGYFGWNIISKHMAAYYMTGDEYHAQEFLRLSFPDAEAIAEIERLDGERIENKHDPLAGPYHYSAHMMILFWDLIEEDPFFTDEQRLDITNALSRQLTHRAKEGVYGRMQPASSVGGRHADWSAMSLWTLARYFDRDYPAPVWQASRESAETFFSGIENSAWFAGMNDHLFWYTSYYDPLLDYMVMSGYRGGMDNLRQALKTQDILFTGQESDWGLRASSLNFLHRAAYITGDGRFIFYRDRTGLDTDALRLGQSWWPDAIEARPPTELLDTWTMQPMPEPMWRARGSDLPLEQQFLWGTWRTTLDGGGDLMMIKGHNGGGRLPYHTFSLMEQRLAGSTLLKGYRNQIITSADGMVEPIVAMDAALLDHGALDGLAWAVGEVPKMAFANWRRSIVQREGRYTLFADDLTFRTDSDNMKIETEWQAVGGSWDGKRNALIVQGTAPEATRDGWLEFAALESDLTCGPRAAEEMLSRLDSIDIILLKAIDPGDWVEMTFTLDEPVTGQVYADLLDFTDRGVLRLWLDGEAVAEGVNHYAAAATRSAADLGEHTLAAGEHTLRLEAMAKRPDAERMYAGLLGVSIRPEGITTEASNLGFEFHPSEVMQAQPGGVVVMQWLGSAREGQQRRFFHLLAPRVADDRLGCYQIAENAAILALPGPALALTGQHSGSSAELAVLATDHLVALGLTDSPLLSAEAPVTVHWDFASGNLQVFATQATSVTAQTAAGPQTIAVQSGAQTLEGISPAPAALQTLGAQLSELLAPAGDERERQIAAAAQPAEFSAAEMSASVTGEIGGAPVASEVIQREDGDLMAIAQGQTVHVLAADGSERHALQTDGAVRVLRWWADHDLLLVGCADEKVIAFDLNTGARKWEFISEMDQAVWEAGKQYWFKSAYPGIHGLHTGIFIGGESQALVGSACTLEILDHEGELIKRMPIFWGNGWKFLIVPGPGDSRDLLVARWPNGTDNLAVVNSESLREVGKRFYGVPSGHTMVGGWTAQNRTGIEWVDVNGDDAPELVSATNGVWNRVTVFDAGGTPLHNAQFGPGPNNRPYETMRDMSVADLDGDGDMEIIVAISEGLIGGARSRVPQGVGNAVAEFADAA